MGPLTQWVSGDRCTLIWWTSSLPTLPLFSLALRWVVPRGPWPLGASKPLTSCVTVDELQWAMQTALLRGAFLLVGKTGDNI